MSVPFLEQKGWVEEFYRITYKKFCSWYVPLTERLDVVQSKKIQWSASIHSNLEGN